jgi:heptosyltransferase II
LSRIPVRVGYRGHSRRWLLNQIVPESLRRGPPEHQANQYLRMAEELGAPLQEDVDLVERDNASPARTRARRDHEMETNTMAGSASPPYQLKIALCPGAEYGPAKRWLPERFAEAAVAIASETPVQWILFGTKNDAAVGETIAAALGDKCLNRIGETTLEELIAELSNCRLVLTNDTGTMHLASLLGLPTVAIFGSTDSRLTGPLGDGHIILRHQVECSPCFLRECPIDFRCMKAIGVQEVVDAVLSILQRSTSSSPLS